MNTKADKGKLKGGALRGPCGGLEQAARCGPDIRGGKGAQRSGVTVEHLKGGRII